MSNCLLSWVNWLDESGVVIAPSSQVATLPASNLLDPIRARLWSASGETSPSLAIDLGASRAIRAVVLAGLNISATDTVRLKLSNVVPGGSELLDTGAVAGVAEGYGYWPWFGAAALTGRYVTLELDADMVTPQAGRLWISDAFQPTRNYDFGEGEAWNDGGVIQRAPRSGAEYVQEGPRWRTQAFALPYLTDAEGRTTAKELQRIAGITGQVMFVKNPDSPYIWTETIIGRLTRTQPILHPHFDIRSTAFEIGESL